MSNIVLKINKKIAVIIVIAVLGLAVVFLSGFIVYLLVVKKEPSSSFRPQKVSPPVQIKNYFYGEKASLIGSVKKFFYGDNNRYVLALFLDEPIDMEAGKSDFEIACQDVDKFQLVNENNLPLSRYENQRVAIAGELMPAHTAHHQTDVLLLVESIVPQNSRNYKKNTLRGFYTHYDKLDWGDAAVTCDALTVIGGDEGLIAKYKDKVEEGNGINYIDNQGRLVVNLDLDYGVDEAVRKTITSSTPGSPVEVELKERDLEVGGVPACFSFFEITEVQP